jgi:hypothetical protein
MNLGSNIPAPEIKRESTDEMDLLGTARQVSRGNYADRVRRWNHGSSLIREATRTPTPNTRTKAEDRYHRGLPARRSAHMASLRGTSGRRRRPKRSRGERREAAAAKTLASGLPFGFGGGGEQEEPLNPSATGNGGAAAAVSYLWAESPRIPASARLRFSRHLGLPKFWVLKKNAI